MWFPASTATPMKMPSTTSASTGKPFLLPPLERLNVRYNQRWAITSAVITRCSAAYACCRVASVDNVRCSSDQRPRMRLPKPMSTRCARCQLTRQPVAEWQTRRHYRVPKGFPDAVAASSAIGRSNREPIRSALDRCRAPSTSPRSGRAVEMELEPITNFAAVTDRWVCRKRPQHLRPRLGDLYSSVVPIKRM